MEPSRTFDSMIPIRLLIIGTTTRPVTGTAKSFRTFGDHYCNVDPIPLHSDIDVLTRNDRSVLCTLKEESGDVLLIAMLGSRHNLDRTATIFYSPFLALRHLFTSLQGSLEDSVIPLEFPSVYHHDKRVGNGYNLKRRPASSKCNIAILQIPKYGTSQLSFKKEVMVE